MGQDLGLGVWLDWECYEPVQFAHSVEINSFLATVREARPTCGVYCDESWAEQLKKDNVPFGRLWLAVDSDTVPKAGQYMTQLAAGPVAGIEGDVDIDVLANTRGVDIPTSPAPRATEAQVAAVRAAADEPEPEA